MESSISRKPTLLARLAAFFGKIFGRREDMPEIVVHSRFQHFAEAMDEEDPSRENVAMAANLCDEALRVARRRLVLVNKMNEVDEKLSELECFFLLDEESARYLKDLLNRFTALTAERNVLLYQLTDFDKTLARMNLLEEDANKALDNMQEAEKKHRILKQDIGYLEGEKADLEYERGLLEWGLVFIRRAVFAAIFAFGAMALYLSYQFLMNGMNIYFPLAALVLCAIVASVVLYMFNKRVHLELKTNIKKQQRAVGMLNKKNVVNVYYTNFLKYEYDKYKVRSTQMLKSHLSDYKHYKHITMRIDAIRKIMYETEAEIERFLAEKSITYTKYTLEQFAKTLNVEDKIDYTRELARDRQIYEQDLLKLDDKHAGVWDLLESVAQKDATEEKIVGQMIQAYFDEMSKMLEHVGQGDDSIK